MLEFTEKLVAYEPETMGSLTKDEATYGAPYLHAFTIARLILSDIMLFRRVSGPDSLCAKIRCEKCVSPHLSKIISAVMKAERITFVLPAFPGKSPNQAKVLGTLPDMAERRALQFLQSLCDRIQKIYSPGAHIILCSDGRVFSDVVGMFDEDVTAYQREIARIISELGLTSLSTFDLDDFYVGMSFDQMRALLMEKYGEPLDTLKASVSRGGKTHGCSEDDKKANRLYCGITRFLVEDATFPGQTQSRAAIQKECRARAYTVIQRSKAWGDFVEAQFQDAVRLSIHPQSCGAKKIGIRLIEPDHWMTPWHGVAVEVAGRFILLKRAQAEALGAKLIYVEGRPSHYFLADENELSKLSEAKHGA